MQYFYFILTKEEEGKEKVNFINEGVVFSDYGTIVLPYPPHVIDDNSKMYTAPTMSEYMETKQIIDEELIDQSSEGLKTQLQIKSHNQFRFYELKVRMNLRRYFSEAAS